MKKIIFLLILFLLISPFIIFSDSSEENQGREENQKKKNFYESESGGSDPFSQVKFVPAISFIMDVSYLNRNVGQKKIRSFDIPGFLYQNAGDDQGHSVSLLQGENGFNLNYAELSLFAAVDPYFDLFTAFHLAEDHFEIEEVYVTMRKLPFGLGMKLGKFLSSFGRLNAQHAHTWNFMEVPLIYRVFFGDEGLCEKGVQINWVAPTDFFLSLGFESLQGENGTSFGIEGFEMSDGDDESVFKIEEKKGPGLFTIFGKTSIDIGDLVILVGVSYAEGESRINNEGDTDSHFFTGRAKVFGLDMTLKYLLDSYRYISLQSEFMSRDLDGRFYKTDLYEGGNFPDIFISDLSRSQSGIYSELVYRFSRLWRTAFRFDLLNRNRVYSDGIESVLPENMKRYSFMIDYSPTEFSRIRLQYNYNDYLFSDGEVNKFGELNLQLNISIGAHGAHPF